MATKTNNKPVLGIGIAALAAAAAGAYYFYGSAHSPQHRKQMKGWMIKARGEMVEKLENLKDMSQENYDKAVSQVMDKYKKVKNIDPKDIQDMATDLRKHWENISGKINNPRKPLSKRAKGK